MNRELWRRSLMHVGVALKDPEGFAAAWQMGQARYALATWVALGATAVAGTVGFGMTVGMGHGLAAVVAKAFWLTAAAGAAWAIPLPALYIFNSLGGSRLSPSTTLLAALVTTSWGGLALLASVPIGWFFTTALSDLPAIGPQLARQLVIGINLLVFAGVGVSMSDVFGRVLRRLEGPDRPLPTWFLLLVGAIGGQLFYLVGAFGA